MALFQLPLQQTMRRARGVASTSDERNAVPRTRCDRSEMRQRNVCEKGLLAATPRHQSSERRCYTRVRMGLEFNGSISVLRFIRLLMQRCTRLTRAATRMYAKRTTAHSGFAVRRIHYHYDSTQEQNCVHAYTRNVQHASCSSRPTRI